MMSADESDHNSRGRGGLGTFTGEDRTFGGNDLFVDLIPRSCWFSNVRTCVRRQDWDVIRQQVYGRAGHRCECCGVAENAAAPATSMEAHERWSYTSQGGANVQKLERLVCLCHACHEATHMGLARVKGRESEAVRHLMQVRGWTYEQAHSHISAAFQLWRGRNGSAWDLDLSVITDNGFECVRPRRGIRRSGPAAALLAAVGL